MNSLNLELPFPPSTNTYYRNLKNGNTVISKKGREYRKKIIALVTNPPLFEGKIHISAVLFPPDKRIRDLDNFDGKALWDSLTYAKVWFDDSQVKSRFSEWGEVVKGGKIYIEVKQIRRG